MNTLYRVVSGAVAVAIVGGAVAAMCKRGQCCNKTGKFGPNESVREHLRHDFTKVHEAVEDAGKTVAENAKNVTHDTAEKVKSFGDAAKEQAEHAVEKVSDASSDVKKVFKP